MSQTRHNWDPWGPATSKKWTWDHVWAMDRVGNRADPLPVRSPTPPHHEFMLLVPAQV